MWTAKPNVYKPGDRWNLACFFFLILLQRTKNLTPPAPKLLFPLEELPKAGREGLQLHRCLVEGQEEVSLCRMPLPTPVPDPLSGSCRTGDKLGKIDRDSKTHSLREIILNLNEFNLPEIEAAQVSTHRGAGQCSRCFSYKTTSSQAPFSRASHCHFQLFLNTGKESVSI